MTIAFIIFFCLLPFAHFIFQKVDIWHAHGYFFQLGILTLLTLDIWKKNKPFSLLVFWIGSLTMFYWITFQIKNGIYAVGMLLPFFNFICMVLLYQWATKHLTKEMVTKFGKCFSIVLFVLLGYGVLQHLNLDQFYKSIWNANTSPDMLQPDYTVGTMGNPMHFAHFLAIACPLFFFLKRNWCFIGLISTIGVILLTGTASGLITTLIVIVFFNIFHRIFTRREILLSTFLSLLVAYWKFNSIKVFFSDAGRFELWGKFVELFQGRPLTGWGLGMVNRYAISNGITIGADKLFVRHTHCEYYHFAIEIGVIGLVLIIWGIIDYYKKFTFAKKDKVNVCMASMFLGFLLSAILGFPAHLWMLAGLGIIGYSFLYGGTYENAQGT